MNEIELIKTAIEARKKSYSPYSGFAVGASLLCVDGTVYSGCNIENAAYSATVCAERVALFKAVSDGKRDFTALAVVGAENNEPCTPCGVCRQALSEFCGDDFEILVAKSETDYKKFSFEELLPQAFRLTR